LSGCAARHAETVSVPIVASTSAVDSATAIARLRVALHHLLALAGAAAKQADGKHEQHGLPLDRLRCEIMDAP
jgi:hypothetical protein